MPPAPPNLTKFSGFWTETGSNNLQEMIDLIGLQENENKNLFPKAVSKLQIIVDENNPASFTILKQTTTKPNEWRRIQRGIVGTGQEYKVKTGLGKGTVKYKFDNSFNLPTLMSELKFHKVKENLEGLNLENEEVFLSKLYLKSHDKLECKLTYDGKSLLKVFAREEQTC